jgi:hypothetical protein
MPVAAAIGAAAVIGAGSSMISASKAAKAQKKAANSQIAFQREQDAEAKRRYEMERADLAPYREAGTGALGQITDATKAGGDFNRDFTMADFVKDPGYDFRQQQGQRGIEASAAARGGVLSGGAMKAIARYNQNFASGEYGQAYDRFNADRDRRYNRLASIAGVGQTAVNSGNSASQNLTNNLQGGVNNNANSLASIGNARASQYVASGNAVGNAVGQVGNYFAMRDLYGSGAIPSSAAISNGVNNFVSQYRGGI